MKIASTLRAALVAIAALAGLSTSALADGGTVVLTIYKAGWIIGGSGGSGVLNFRGRSYGLSTGGLDYGLVFGGSKTVLRGRVSNINRPSDVAGVYGVPPAPALPSAAAPAPSCSPTRRARDLKYKPFQWGASTYKVVSKPLPTFTAASDLQIKLRGERRCTL